MLNNNQKSRLNTYLEFIFDSLPDMESDDKYIVYQCMLDNKISEKNSLLLNKLGVEDDVNHIHQLKNHPYPQNRSSGDGDAFQHEVLKGKDPTTAEEKKAMETGVYQKKVYFYTHDESGLKKGPFSEEEGLLGLTSLADDKSENATQTDVIHFIEDKIKEKMNKLKKDLMPDEQKEYINELRPFLNKIQEMHQWGISDPASILTQLVDDYYKKRIAQDGVLYRFFQNSTNSIISFFRPNSIENNSIYEQIAKIQTPLEKEFANILSAFFSYYPMYLEKLDASVKEKLPIIDALSFQFIAKIPLTDIIRQLNLQSSQLNFSYMLSGIAKIMSKIDRDRIVVALLAMPASMNQLISLARMENSLSENFHSDVVRRIEAVIRSNPEDVLDSLDLIEPLCFVIKDENLRASIRQTIENYPNNPSSRLNNWKALYERFLTMWGKPAFRKLPSDENNSQKKSLQNYLEHLKENGRALPGNASLIKKFITTLSSEDKKLIAEKMVNEAHYYFPRQLKSSAAELREVRDIIPEEYIRQLFEYHLKKANLNFSDFIGKETPDRKEVMNAQYHYRRSAVNFIDEFADAIPDSQFATPIVNLMFAILSGNISIPGTSFSEQSSDDEHYIICLHVLEKMGASIPVEIRDEVLNKILTIEISWAGNDSLVTERSHACEVMGNLWNLGSPQLRDLIIDKLIVRSADPELDVSEAACVSLVKISQLLDYPQAIALISRLEEGRMTHYTTSNVLAINAISEMIYDKKRECLMQQQLKNLSLTKIVETYLPRSP